ncbi:hypothetical protein PG999_006947 [Apiospora kogelbergensis]|uniref:Zn(2)-C6 fungal-type domain-containing protein n=1 Tax=Apiospora kogelbergensis TaxID=1337665 RepID=A0AAW0QWY8_9PEZI
MVGVPRSNACALCLSRRVKCDEARPSCSNCVKYGADCPGYARGLKFVAGKHVVKSRARGGTVAFTVSSRNTSPPSASSFSSPSSHSRDGTRRPSSRRPSARRVPDAVSPPASRGIPPPRRTLTQGDAGELKKQEENSSEQNTGQSQSQQQRFLTSYEKLQSAMAHVTAVSVITPRDDRAQFIGMLMKSLEESQPESEMVVLETWFQETASHLGQKPSLDRASCAFALQLLGRNHHDECLLAQSRTLYGQSLWMLQRALNHPTEWKSPETLNSAMILCHFELFAGTATTSSWSTWMKHALGVGRLIQLRGPGSFDTEWERAILLSFRPIMSVTFDDDNDGQIPAAVKYLYMLRAVSQQDAVAKAMDAAEVARIRQSMLHIRDAFETWYQRILPFNPPPIEMSTQDPASIYPTVLRYESPWKGALHMGYWASLCIVYATLMECHQAFPSDDGHSDDDGYDTGAAVFELLSDRILRSVETVGNGMMGPYRCGYSVRIAYEVVDEHTQAWIRMWIARFEKRYAATAVESYPSPSDVFLPSAPAIEEEGRVGGHGGGLLGG